MVSKMNKRKRMARGVAIFVALAAMAVIVRAIIRKRRPRITYGPMHERDRIRYDYLNQKIWQSDVLCKNMLRFERAAFFRLCGILRDHTFIGYLYVKDMYWWLLLDVPNELATWLLPYDIIAENCVLCQYILLCCFSWKYKWNAAKFWNFCYSIFPNQTLERNQPVLLFCTYQTQERNRPVPLEWNHSIPWQLVPQPNTPLCFHQYMRVLDLILQVYSHLLCVMIR